MRQIKIIIFFIFLSAILTDASKAIAKSDLKACNYIHLILTGESNKWSHHQSFNQVHLPLYIGYIKSIQKIIGDEEVEILSFVRKTTLPIDWINRALEEVIRTRSVHIFADGIRSRNYYYAERSFPSALSEMLETLGVNEIITERYMDFYIQGDFPPPLLKADDFEYDKTCVYRPYANPTEYFSDLYPVTLVNKNDLEARIKAYYDAYDERKRMKLFLRGGRFFNLYGY